MALYTTTTISIEDQQFTQFDFLHLKQFIKHHHEFELGIGYGWLSRYGSNVVTAGSRLLGKEISICIQPVEPAFSPLLFNGIITGVSAGKESSNNTGSCIIRGNSPTILLSGSPHIRSFEQQPLSSIVNTVIKNCYPFAVAPQVNPSFTQPLEYIVQYKETGFDFIRRLSQRFGEHFFYNGQQIIFGHYSQQKTDLVFLEDLVNFQLNTVVHPVHQTFQTYNYSLHKILEEDSRGVSLHLNPYSQHALSVSRKLFPGKTIFKIPYASTGNSTLTAFTQRFHKSRIAALVRIHGKSRNTSLCIGNTVSIHGQPDAVENHGEFMLTTLAHYCNGNGDYYNTFEGIPADTAVPVMDSEKFPRCGAQSATVTDNNDPEGLGRIRVRFNWQQGHSPWIRLCQPHSGRNKGFHFIPEINEEVWVDFEEGNPEAPYVTGCTYNGKASSGFGDPLNNIKAIKTRSGHLIRLDDTDGNENIIITDQGGNTIMMDTRGQHISLSAPEKISITARNININAAENISIDAGNNINHSAGIDILQHAGNCLYQYTVNDYQLTATNITKIALENINIQAREIEKHAEEINIDSSREDLQISSGKSVCIKSTEKSKLF
ncbi:type VI secretion system tip protein VgrG [Chitinophaga sp. OAE865]|uniref:type VI secretion system Vgr family protein n=1 Tax=Chitinophaga sp. OAE865 TaxID=2817898 RepID=UPI001AE1905B